MYVHNYSQSRFVLPTTPDSIAISPTDHAHREWTSSYSTIFAFLIHLCQLPHLASQFTPLKKYPNTTSTQLDDVHNAQFHRHKHRPAVYKFSAYQRFHSFASFPFHSSFLFFFLRIHFQQPRIVCRWSVSILKKNKTKTRLRGTSC